MSEANRSHIKPWRSWSHYRLAISRGEGSKNLWWQICVNPSSPFVCLPHMYTSCFAHELPWVANRSIVDLGATVQKNKDTPKAIVVMHALSGRDTITASYNVGKQRAMKQPTQTICPFAGDSQADLDEICSSAMWMRIVCVLFVQFACVASSILPCFVFVKLAHRVSNHWTRDHVEDEGDYW